MKNVHGLTWLGLIINVVVMFGALVHINEDYRNGNGMRTLNMVFSLIYFGCTLLQIIGLAMLITSNRAGSIVGIIGTVFFMPIGLICAYGFFLSRRRMPHRDHEIPPSETPTVGIQSVANRLDTAAVAPQANDPLPASESVQAETPLARYAFEDKSWQWYTAIVLGIVGIAHFYSSDLAINIWLVPIMISVPMSIIVGMRLLMRGVTMKNIFIS